MRIRIGINGACGRMGLRLVNLSYRQPDLQLTLAIEQPGHPAIGKDIALVAGLGLPSGILVESGVNRKICDIILDFSTPQATMTCVRQCKKYRIALLIGTTGLNREQAATIKAGSKKIPLLISPNFSQGASLLGKLGQELLRRLGKDADVEIVETHHRTKKDAPSGTALRLAQELKSASPAQGIAIHSLRLGEVIGEHKIVFGMPGERIELTHQVDTRDAFAYGALKMARILAKKKPGFYTITDILESARI